MYRTRTDREDAAWWDGVQHGLVAGVLSGILVIALAMVSLAP